MTAKERDRPCKTWTQIIKDDLLKSRLQPGFTQMGGLEKSHQENPVQENVHKNGRKTMMMVIRLPQNWVFLKINKAREKHEYDLEEQMAVQQCLENTIVSDASLEIKLVTLLTKCCSQRQALQVVHLIVQFENFKKFANILLNLFLLLKK